MSKKIFPSVSDFVASIRPVLEILLCRLYSVVSNLPPKTADWALPLTNGSNYFSLQYGVEYRQNTNTEQHNDKYDEKRNLERVMWDRIANDGEEDSIRKKYCY